MRKVLVVAYFFPPLGGGGVSRTVGLVRYLHRYGWEPIVLSVDDPDYRFIDRTRLDDLPEGLIVERTRKPRLTALRRLSEGRGSGKRSGRGHSLLRRAADWLLIPDPYVTWVVPAFRAGMRLARAYRPEAVLTTSPPLSSHLVGLGLAAAAGIGWTADFRDPWTKWMSLGAPTPLHRAIHRRLEQSVLGRAGSVTAVHPDFFDLEPMTGGGPGLTHVPGGFDPELTVTGPPRPKNGPFSLIFTGSLTRLVRADSFLRGLKRLTETRPEVGGEVAVTFYGFRDRENEEEAAGLGLGKMVGFHDPVSHRRALALQAEADALLLLLPDATGIETCYAGKLFEYLASGRPILAIVPERSAAAQLVRRLGAGIVVDPKSPDAVAAAVLDLVRDRRAVRPPEPESLAPYDLRRLAGEMAGALDRCAGRTSRE